MRKILLAILLASACLAQLNTGEISGTVTDMQGLAVSGARVSILNELTGQRFESRSNDLGGYLGRALPVGRYTVVVENDGFKRYSRAGLSLTAGQVLRVDVRMELGAVSETVSVTAEAPPVNVTTSTLDTQIDDKRLVDLPMNGRNVLSLASLTPGVTRTALANGPSSDQQRINVNGNRSYSTNVMLDGASLSYGHRGQALIQPPPEALAEVKVITSGVGADTGRGSAAISAVTKGGTNQFHGALWNYFRNDKLDARSFFANSVPKLRYNQFGGGLGGPIRRNRAFFYAAYQGLESRSDAVVSSAFPPTALERGGDFSRSPGARPVDPLNRQPFPNSLIPRNRLDPVALKLAALIPEPNRPNGQYVAQRVVPTSSHLVMGRGDYDFTAADRTSVRYFFDHPTTVNPFPQGSNVDGYNTSSPNHITQNINGVHNHTFSPSSLLAARFSYTRFRFSELNSVRTTLADLGAKFVTGGGAGSLPQLTVTGRMQPSSSYETLRKLSETYEIAPDMSWFKGKHEVRYGAFTTRQRYWSNQAGRAYGWLTFNGTFSGNSMSDFFLGSASELRQEAARSNDASYRSYGGYVQDRWRVTPRLTLNFGLRSESFTPWRTPDGQFHALVPGARSQTFPTAPAGVLWQDDPGFPYQADLVNIGPRAGFAWDVFGGGKTSVRGGYSVSYDPLIGQIAAQNAQPFGTDILTTNVGPLTDPQRNIDVPYGKPLDLKNPTWTLPWTMTTSFEGNVRTAYSQNVNLTVEQQVARETLVQASYVATLGRKLTITRQQNPAVLIPGNSTTRNIDQRRIYWPTFGSVVAYTTDANSDYHALQVVLNRRFHRGHTVLVSYAFAKAIDEVGTGEVANWAAQNPWDRRGSRGLGDFDVRHRLVASWLWELPFFARRDGLVGRVLGGWQFSGIATIQDGTPFSVVSGRDNSVQGVNIPYGGDRPNLLGDPALPASRPKQEMLTRYFDTSKFVMNGAGEFGNSGRNILIGPGDCDFDVSLNKRFAVSEGKDIAFRWEMFNATNRASFGNPAANLSGAANFGRITGAAAGRIMQLALRYEF